MKQPGYGSFAMPTYHYVCEKCGHDFEFVQSMKDEPLQVCPKEKCGAKRWGKGKVSRMITAGAGLLFKGSGFYITDYRSEGYKAAAKKESQSTTPKKEGGGDSKSETKPAAPKPASS
jgi:putative FmdB family regulatory protein